MTSIDNKFNLNCSIVSVSFSHSNDKNNSVSRESSIDDSANILLNLDKSISDLGKRKNYNIDNFPSKKQKIDITTISDIDLINELQNKNLIKSPVNLNNQNSLGDDINKIVIIDLIDDDIVKNNVINLIDDIVENDNENVKQNENIEQNLINNNIQNNRLMLCKKFNEYYSINKNTSLNKEPIAINNEYFIKLLQMPTENELMLIAESFFDSDNVQKWKNELKIATQISQHERFKYINSYSRKKSPNMKIIFQMLLCSDFFYSEQGQELAKNDSINMFINDFKDSILRVLLNKKSNFNKNRNYKYRLKILNKLFSTLPLVYFCIKYLMEKNLININKNLAQLLLFASCLETKGVYHSRCSSNLSLSLKCYRYLIEKISGKDYKSKPVELQEISEKELILLFEPV